jgi:hypothetical protein
VLLAWGRLATSQWRRQVLEFDALEEAAAEAQAQAERRLKRGYRLVFEV